MDRTNNGGDLAALTGPAGEEVHLGGAYMYRVEQHLEKFFLKFNAKYGR
jgi:hypothetical protein